MTEQKRENNDRKTPPCEEREWLTDEFLASARALMNLQNQQVQAVIEHDHDFSRFDDLIHLARQKKDQAKYALIAHLENHRC